MKEKSLLRNDKEISIPLWQWSESRGASSRHREGVCFYPQMTEAGELVLSGLPNGQEPVFRWKLPQNP